MNAEFDYDLTPHQWEVLRALRSPASKGGALSRFVVEGLVALQLAATIEGRLVLTEKGRKVLVRGSSRLLDVAA